MARRWWDVRTWGRAELPANYAPVDALTAALFSPGGVYDLSALAVTERSSLSISALYRGVSLISGTLASLPLNSWRGQEPQTRQRVPSVFDDPDPDGQTPFEWKESAFIHLVLHGRTGALKVKNGAGAVVALPLVHPLCFTVRQPQRNEAPAGGLWFDVRLADGASRTLDADDFWYVPGPSTSEQDGMGLISVGKSSLATSLAGERASQRAFTSGALISGLATPEDPEEDITEDVPEIRRQLNNSVHGQDNAGAIAIVNRRLKFTPWTMTAQQAQFLESRQFQIEEIARWTGVPPHLLMQTDKQTSWGTGVDEQNRGLSRFVLGHWAQRFEQRASRLLARPRWCEFDFAGLERPNFAVEIELLVKQVQAGLLTIDEARAVRNLPPLNGALDATE